MKSGLSRIREKLKQQHLFEQRLIGLRSLLDGLTTNTKGKILSDEHYSELLPFLEGAIKGLNGLTLKYMVYSELETVRKYIQHYLKLHKKNKPSKEYIGDFVKDLMQAYNLECTPRNFDWIVSHAFVVKRTDGNCLGGEAEMSYEIISKFFHKDILITGKNRTSHRAYIEKKSTSGRLSLAKKMVDAQSDKKGRIPKLNKRKGLL